MKPLLALVALSILLSYSGVHAATSQPSATATVNNDARPAENFTGTIVLLNGSLYILRDVQNDSWYRLDDQEMPKKFLGKKVVVTGKLDSGVNVISVHNIEPSNG